MKKLSDLRGQAMVLLLGYCRAAAPGRAGAQFRSGGRLRAFLRSGSEGQSIMEFAFVVPILMTVLTGIVVIGFVMQNYQQLTNVENQGMITLQQLPDTAAASDPCNAVATAIIGAAANLKTSGTSGIQMSLSFGTGSSTVYYPTSGTTSPTGFTCQGGSTYVVQGEPASLTVTYPSSFFGFKLTPNGLLSFTESEQI